jgi:hypothetical protein
MLKAEDFDKYAAWDESHEIELDTLDSATDAVAGWTVEYRIAQDYSIGAPWEEHDGYGVVSEWTARDKRAGERLLHVDGYVKRYYDVQATTEKARRDGWGCGIETHTHKTKGERVACAVERDFQRLRDWCRNEWTWIVLLARVRDAEGREVGHEALGGVESDGDYWREQLAEMANGIIQGELTDSADCARVVAL